MRTMYQQIDEYQPTKEERAIEAVESVDEAIALLNSFTDDTYYHQLARSVHHKRMLTSSADMARFIRAFMFAPHFGKNALGGLYWMVWGQEATFLDIIKTTPNLPSSALEHIMGHWRLDSIEITKAIIDHPNSTPDIARKGLSDWRVSVNRHASKSGLLDSSVLAELVSSGDVQIRKNIIKNPRLDENSLRILAADLDASVAKAAKREIKKRGLPETDEMDESISDGVSAYFLAASDDEATLKRLATSPDIDTAILEGLSEHSRPVAMAAASNSRASADFLMQMCRKAVEDRDSDVAAVLAKNPALTEEATEILGEMPSYYAEVTKPLVKHPNCAASVIESRATDYRASIRISVLRSPHCTEDMITRMSRWEHRKTVLVEIAKHELTPTEVLVDIARGDGKRGTKESREIAEQRLADQGYTLTPLY